MRGDVLTIKSQEFIMAAKSSGMREYRIILRHILPNVLSSIMVSATLGIASAIITESALSFLGLGFPSDFPTWGRLLFDGANFLQLTPSRVLWPGLAISLTVLECELHRRRRARCARSKGAEELKKTRGAFPRRAYRHQ